MHLFWIGMLNDSNITCKIGDGLEIKSPPLKKDLCEHTNQFTPWKKIYEGATIRSPPLKKGVGRYERSD